jgi:hypothetical protein
MPGLSRELVEHRLMSKACFRPYKQGAQNFKPIIVRRVKEEVVIPRSVIAETKPPYVCLGCFIHTYSNNMINRFPCSVIQSTYLLQNDPWV